MWATIIISESFTRIMGSTADGNLYSTIVRLSPSFLDFMDPGWGGAEFPTGGGQTPLPPQLAPAL